ncbi:MAG: DUF3298 domain-containing protein [Firmicutes bacterium]|nr:DUF3298 domain-containing protein [Bacillota bacterium]
MRKTAFFLALLFLAFALCACASVDNGEETDPELDHVVGPSLSYRSACSDGDGDAFAAFEMSVPHEVYDVFHGGAALKVSDDLMAFAERESAAWQDGQEALRQQEPELDSEFTLDLALFYYDDEIVAVTGSGYSYVSGAAHPNAYAYGFVYDAVSGQRIAIDQLLGADWQEKLFPAVYAQVESSGALDAYFQPLETLLSDAFRDDGWYADAENIYVVYNAATVAPYAAGTPVFSVPR